jgi:hypothetical protein
MYGDEVREQNSLNSFKRTAESKNDYIESYHDNSSEDVEMDGTIGWITVIRGKSH